MANKCKVCNNPNTDEINRQLVEGVTLETISSIYGITVAALHRHQKNHIPAHLVKAKVAKETAAANSLMARVSKLDAKAEDIYLKAMEAENLTAAIGAVRELRSTTELYTKVMQAETVNNNMVIISPEWAAIRTSILKALDPYPDAKQAVIQAVGSD